ncbi:MAG: hypothetical protein QNJ97_12800 [Myxococcota bacterium]|nr:hypothetical protein [Myxococcota bacterium]
MTDAIKGVLRDQLLFSGMIGANLSHEINNVLATIAELNGLTEDLATFGDPADGVGVDKLRSITERMDVQIERGKRIAKLLNRYSHAGEEGPQPMDIEPVLSELTDLTDRLARLRKVEMEIFPPDKRISITAQRFDLLHALFRLVWLALNAASEGSKLNICCTEEDEWICFDITSDHVGKGVESSAKAFETIDRIARLRGGDIQSTIGPDGPWSISLRLPKQLHPTGALTG